MKHTTARLFILVLITCLFCGCLTACGGLAEGSDKNRELCEQMIECIRNDDSDGAYELVKNVATRKEVNEVFPEWQAALSGVDEYELTAKGWHYSTSGGVRVATINYLLTNDSGRTVAIQLATVSNIDGIGGFSLKDNTEFVSKTSSIPTFDIILIVISLIALVFMIVMIVDCARHKMRVKWLWIIIILAGIGVNLTLGAGGVNFGFNIMLLPLSRIQADPILAAISARFSLPVGAIIYAAVRKRLFIKEEPTSYAAQNTESQY